MLKFYSALWCCIWSTPIRQGLIFLIYLKRENTLALMWSSRVDRCWLQFSCLPFYYLRLWQNAQETASLKTIVWTSIWKWLHYSTFPSVIIKAIENISLQLQNINNMKISYLYLTCKMLSLTDWQQEDICKMGMYLWTKNWTLPHLNINRSDNKFEFFISRQVTMQRLIKEWTAFYLLKYDLI